MGGESAGEKKRKQAGERRRRPVLSRIVTVLFVGVTVEMRLQMLVMEAVLYGMEVCVRLQQGGPSKSISMPVGAVMVTR
jgi:hypothetical protein